MDATGRRDLIDIYVTIGTDNRSAADRVYDRLRDVALLLRDNPRLGPARSEIGKSARILVQGSYLIIYRILPDEENVPARTIEIIRVVDGRRDLSALF